MFTLKIQKNGLKIQLTNKKEFIEYFNLTKDESGKYIINGEYKSISEALEDTGYLGNNWSDLEDCIALFSGDVFGYDAFINDEGEVFPDPKETFYHEAVLSFWFEDLANAKNRYIILPRIPYDPEYAAKFDAMVKEYYETHQ